MSQQWPGYHTNPSPSDPYSPADPDATEQGYVPTGYEPNPAAGEPPRQGVGTPGADAPPWAAEATAPYRTPDPTADWGQPQSGFDPATAGRPYDHGYGNHTTSSDHGYGAPYGYGPGHDHPGSAIAPYPAASPYAQFGDRPNSSRSKVAAALLAFFLGTLGVHNFYLGHTGRGIAQLLITVLSLGFLAPFTAIWALIEFVLILTGSLTDADGRPLSN